MDSHDQMVQAREEMLEALGFGYEESTLTDEEKEGVDPKLIKQYERGILSGGELDCIVRRGKLPWND